MARKMSGFSLEDLSGKIGGIVTRQALSKYEKGRMNPSPEVFGRLNEALAIRPDAMADLSSKTTPAPEVSCFLREQVNPYTFRDEDDLEPLRGADRVPDLLGDMAGLASRRRFRMRRESAAPASPTSAEPPFLSRRTGSRPPASDLSLKRVHLVEPSLGGPQSIDHVRFREKENVPAKTAVALRLRVEDYIRRCLEIESDLGIEHNLENPLAGREIKTADDVEAAAREVRRVWSLGTSPVTNLLGLLEEKGIRVFEVRGIQGFEGLSGNCGGVPFITVNRDFPDDRMRFTAAHELGHILCGFPEKEGAESLCHQFAGAFLLPAEVARLRLIVGRRKISLWELKEIKEEYGISLQAIVRRARTLGIVTGRKERSFREMMREKGWLMTEPVEYRGNERATRLMRILSYAVAEKIIPPERAAALAGVSASELMGELGQLF